MDSRGFVAVYGEGLRLEDTWPIPSETPLNDFVITDQGLIFAGKGAVWRVNRGGTAELMFNLPETDPRLHLSRWNRLGVHHDNLCVYDSLLRRIYIRSPVGTPMAVLGGGGEGPLVRVTALRETPRKELLVCDTARELILVYGEGNEFRTAYGRGVLHAPLDVCAWGADRLLVLEQDRLVTLGFPGGEKLDELPIESPKTGTTPIRLLPDPHTRNGSIVYIVLADGGVLKANMLLKTVETAVVSPRQEAAQFLSHPLDVVVDASDTLYVTDRSRGLCRFTREGQLTTVPLESAGLSSFRPFEVALSPAGQLAVYGTPSSIGLFALDGSFVRWIVKESQDAFAIPTAAGMSFDSQGDLYVCDPLGQRVQKIGSGGAFLMALPFPPSQRITKDYTTHVVRESPNGVALTSTGQIVVGSSTGNVRVFEPDGRQSACFRASTSPGETLVADVACTRGDYVVVSNASERALQVYSLAGELVRAFKLSESPATQGVTPGALCIGRRGQLYVVDERNAALVEFTPQGENASGTAG